MLLKVGLVNQNNAMSYEELKIHVKNVLDKYQNSLIQII